MPKEEKKVPIGSRVKPSVLRAIESLADADDRTIAYMVERAIVEYIEKHAPPPSAPRRTK